MIPALRSAGLVVVLAALGVVAVLQGTPTHGDTPRTPGPIVRADTFSRLDDATQIGRDWRSVSGTWGIEREKAYLALGSNGSNIAIFDGAFREGTASVTVSGRFDGAGMVFRYRDAQNYWALIASAPDARWNIVKVIDGRPTVFGQFGEVSVEQPARVSVELDGSDIYVWADELLRATAPRHFTDDALADAPGVGLFADDEASGARFDNFTVAR